MPDPIGPVQWLFQPVIVPLAGLLAAVLLPAGYLAKIARKAIENRVNGLNE